MIKIQDVHPLVSKAAFALLRDGTPTKLFAYSYSEAPTKSGTHLKDLFPGYIDWRTTLYFL